MLRIVAGVLLTLVLAVALVATDAQPALSQIAPKADADKAEKKSGAKTKSDTGDGKSKRPLTAQQQKLKDCGAKWQEEKKAKGVKGRDAWNKFRSECLKS